MITAQDIKLFIGSNQFVKAKSVTFEAKMQLQSYTPLPGSEEDDGWEHYRAGTRSYDVDTDALLTENYDYVKRAAEGKVTEQSISININDNGSTHRISGRAFIGEVTIQAPVNSLTKFTAKLTPNGIPGVI